MRSPRCHATALLTQLLVLLLQTPSGVSGCSNDTACYTRTDGAWACEATRGSSGSPCRINGHQPPTPPYTPWPVVSCTCTPQHGCSPPPAPPKSSGYACRSARCIPVLHGATANTSASCEWSSGCVGLAANEWLAATFEFKLAADGRHLTCVHERAVLKKSELNSATLPPAEVLHIEPNTTIALTAAPHNATDRYWVVSCAAGPRCITHGAATRAQQPRYLMIGDSISLGYLAGVTQSLAGEFAVTHSQGNAGNMNKIFHLLECFLKQVTGPAFGDVPGDVVSFNAGIHDLALGQEWLSAAAYRALLEKVTARLVNTQARVLWVATTPVPTNATNASISACPEGILDADIRSYNTIAAAVVRARGIEVVDLHGAVTKACGAVGYSNCSAFQRPNNPHFVDAGWKLLSAAVSAAVRN